MDSSGTKKIESVNVPETLIGMEISVRKWFSVQECESLMNYIINVSALKTHIGMDLFV